MVGKQRKCTTKRVSRERGASLMEYALLASLIAIVALIGVRSVGNQVEESFNESRQTAFGS